MGDELECNIYRHSLCYSCNFSVHLKLQHNKKLIKSKQKSPKHMHTWNHQSVSVISGKLFFLTTSTHLPEIYNQLAFFLLIVIFALQIPGYQNKLPTLPTQSYLKAMKLRVKATASYEALQPSTASSETKALIEDVYQTYCKVLAALQRRWKHPSSETLKMCSIVYLPRRLRDCLDVENKLTKGLCARERKKREREKKREEKRESRHWLLGGLIWAAAPYQAPGKG